MFEQALQNSLYHQDHDKSYIDKILAVKEIERIKELQKKEKLTRSELLELMYSCLQTEAKLVNYGEYDRYVILKFFVWVREFIKVAEKMYDIKDDFEKKQKAGIYKLKPRTEEILNINEREIEHISKFLIDLYLNIARTTLSIGASGFKELISNKFEFAYPQAATMTVPESTQKKGLVSWLGGK